LRVLYITVDYYDINAILGTPDLRFELLPAGRIRRRRAALEHHPDAPVTQSFESGHNVLLTTLSIIAACSDDPKPSRR